MDKASPCMNCTCRTSICHSACKFYAEWQIEHEKYNADYKKEIASHPLIQKYMFYTEGRNF